MTSARWVVAAVALVAPLAACSEETPFEVIEQVAFDPALGIDLSAMIKLPEGVYIRDDVVGAGALLVPGDTANVDHTGWLRNGDVFSSSQFCLVYLGPYNQLEPCVTAMIEGVNIGVDGMAVGGTRLMIIPPELAYGRDPPPTSIIPEGAVVVFEFTLISIR